MLAAVAQEFTAELGEGLHLNRCGSKDDVIQQAAIGGYDFGKEFLETSLNVFAEEVTRVS